MSSQSKTIWRTLARPSRQARSPFLFPISVTTVRVSVYSGSCTPVRRSARGSVPGCAQYDAATERNPVGISKLRVLIPIPRRSTRGCVDPGSCGLQVRCPPVAVSVQCPRHGRRDGPRQSQSPPFSLQPESVRFACRMEGGPCPNYKSHTKFPRLARLPTSPVDPRRRFFFFSDGAPDKHQHPQSLHVLLVLTKKKNIQDAFTVLRNTWLFFSAYDLVL